MTPSQLTLFFWNGETGSSFSLLEELLYVAKCEGHVQPVLCDGAIPSRFRNGSWGKNDKSFLQDAVRQAVFGKIPYIPLTQLSGFLRTIGKKRPREQYDGLSFFIAADESMLARFSSTQARILCLLKPDPSAVSFLYNLLRKAQQTCPDYPEILIAVRDIRKIEEAADFFAKVHQEVSSLLDGDIPMSFCGTISLNEEKLSIVSRDSTGSLTDLFPGDSFHGQLKYASKLLACAKTESTATDESALLEIVGKLSGEA